MYKISDVFYENIFHIFLEYCNTNNLYYMTDLDGFDFSKLKDVKGIGVSKIETIKKKYKKYTDSNLDENIFSQVHPDNFNLSIQTLTLFGISKNIVSSLCDSGISTIKSLVEYGNSNLYKINSNVYKKIINVLSYYKAPVCEGILLILEEFKKEENYEVVLKRAKGITLTKIGSELNVTRERVRQIEVVKLQKLKIMLDVVLEDIVRKNDYKSCINLNKLELYFKDNDDLSLMKYTLSVMYKDFYLEFCNKLLINGYSREKVLDRLNGITEYYIKDIVNFTKKMVVITESLYKNNIPYIDIEDLTNYLLLNGYIKKGNYIFKAGISYGLICALIVKTHFRGGIKIHDDNDLSELRRIIKEEFDGLELPDNNRALGTRISYFLVLCDRGCYTVASNIKIPDYLLSEIRDYISNSVESTLFFNDIFVQFKDKLLKSSNIKNRYFLQGILKYFYEDEFIFERDSLTKIGHAKKSIRELISEFIRDAKRPVHRREIKEHFPGATEVVITNSQISNKDILQWEYNYYIHSDNLNITKDDKDLILASLHGIFDEYKGYCSEQLLYDKVISKSTDLLRRNYINNASNLFYLASNLYKDRFMFRRPHILKDKIGEQELSSRIIIEKFLFDNGRFSYSDYQNFVTKVKWSIGTAYAVFKDIEKDIVRVSEDEYVVKKEFNLDKKTVDKVFSVIEEQLKNREFVSVGKFSEFSKLPDIGFEWNPFVLSSVVQLYLPDNLRLIVPLVEDRRYVKEIIVFKDFYVDSYEQLVIHIIKKNNLNASTLYHLESVLSSMGLIGRYLPKELYNSKNIFIENDRFYTV